MIELNWLPVDHDWNDHLALAIEEKDEGLRWHRLVSCARSRIDFTRTAKLDRVLQKQFAAGPPAAAGRPVRLALLGSSTLKHLVPGMRVGALRHGLWLEVIEGEYGQYRQELLNDDSPLDKSSLDIVLLALDANHVVSGAGGSVDVAIENMAACWESAKTRFGAVVIQQTLLATFPRLMGNNEQQDPTSPAAMLDVINAKLRASADKHGVLLLAVDSYAAAHGVREWCDPVLWHHSKQEVHPRASHYYGELVGRLLGAVRGRSSKCLVLDLDNTLWGGVIGDDGLEGIKLGQGSTTGEAFVATQQYALQLERRGVILAVCSKNDEANARLPFEKHPDMVLRLKDIACFVANWQDKAANLRYIAKTLNIGLDALVFVDDNPFERNLVRQELPEVQVPELTEDPAFYVETIADAGYFESLAITAEDRERSSQYQANTEREKLLGSTTDMGAYLNGLAMKLDVRTFDSIGLARIVQLINKTNQFNLTTRRYTESEVRAIMVDPNAAAYQFRLTDRFGDNGMIAVLIGMLQDGSVLMDTWLMSCRVLGRQVEEACLNVMVDASRRLGATTLKGEYIPTAKNAMVGDLYQRLGFTLESSGSEGSTFWTLALNDYEQKTIAMDVLLESAAQNS